MSGWLDKRGGLEATKVRNFTFHIVNSFMLLFIALEEKMVYS